MHKFKCWRANGPSDRGNPDGLLHVICYEGAFEGLPHKVRSLGPWQGSYEGEVVDLRPHYRALLAEQGFCIVFCRPTQFAPGA